MFPFFLSRIVKVLSSGRREVIGLDDREIVALYLARSERAVAETQAKYGRYCRAVAGRLLGDAGEAEEVVNDALLAAWDAIPPHRPENLSTFLGKLTRRIAVNRWQSRAAGKRGGGEAALCLDELGECLPAGGGPEEALEGAELSAAISRWLRMLSADKRRAFVLRYWYACPVKEIAARFGWSGTKTANLLSRARAELKTYLEREYFA